MRMSEKTMTRTALAITNVTPGEAAERLKALDPSQRYSVVVMSSPPPDEAWRRLDAAMAAAPLDPALAGMSEEQVMDLCIAEIKAHRAERHRKRDD